MKTAEEIFDKHVFDDMWRNESVEAMEEYAEQFKPNWVSVDTELPEFIPGVEGYGMNNENHR